MPEGVKFCPKCGNSLKTTCPYCGKEIPLGKKFCLYCGADLEGRPKTKKKKSALPILIAVFLVIFLGAAVGGAAVFFHFSSRPDAVAVADSGDEEEKDRKVKADEGEEREADEEETERETEELSEPSQEETAIASEAIPTAAPSQESTMQQTPPAHQLPGDAYQQTAPTNQQLVQNSQYVIPDSGTRYLTAADLAGLSKDQLRLARNEIYARHGRTFNDEELQAYFNSQPWYRGTVAPDDFDTAVLNEYEKANLLFIKDAEDQMQ